MAEPAYSFSLPSIEDDTQLDCRIYHPKTLQSKSSDKTSPPSLRGAIVAHPYAPLGGSYDDQVVLSVSETLLEEGFVVGTFNFRGAGDSAGRTSWTGKAEQNDHISVIGFLVNYLKALLPMSTTAMEAKADERIELVLSGYSYGSLILAQLAPITTMMQRFEAAVEGTAASEIMLRAKTLAAETVHSLEIHSNPTSPRGRQLKPEDATTSPSRRSGVSPITVGGEETDPSVRRRSRDSRRSTDFMRKSLDKVHVGKRRTSKSIQKNQKSSSAPSTSSGDLATITPVIRYLIISPVVLPLTNSLCPPGPPSIGLASFGRQADSSGGSQFLSNPTLAVFGSKDVFTSSKRLRGWAEKQSKSLDSKFEWQEIEGAGHFWREEDAMERLQKRIGSWVKSGR